LSGVGRRPGTGVAELRIAHDECICTDDRPDRRRNESIGRLGCSATRGDGDRKSHDPKDHYADRRPTAASATDRRRRGCGHALIDPSCSIPEQEAAPFGNPANSESPVALRPRLTTGVPFSWRPAGEHGQPHVHVRRITRVRFAASSGYRQLVRAGPAAGYETSIPAVHIRVTQPVPLSSQKSRQAAPGHRVTDDRRPGRGSHDTAAASAFATYWTSSSASLLEKGRARVDAATRSVTGKSPGRNPNIPR
jgi:hypothetical protein